MLELDIVFKTSLYGPMISHFCSEHKKLYVKIGHQELLMALTLLKV